MSILSISSVVKNKSVNEIRDFPFEKYYKRVVFSKENSYYSMKDQRKRSAIVCN